MRARVRGGVRDPRRRAGGPGARPSARVLAGLTAVLLAAASVPGCMLSRLARDASYVPVEVVTLAREEAPAPVLRWDAVRSDGARESGHAPLAPLAPGCDPVRVRVANLYGRPLGEQPLEVRHETFDGATGHGAHSPLLGPCELAVSVEHHRDSNPYEEDAWSIVGQRLVIRGPGGELSRVAFPGYRDREALRSAALVTDVLTSPIQALAAVATLPYLLFDGSRRCVAEYPSLEESPPDWADPTLSVFYRTPEGALARIALDGSDREVLHAEVTAFQLSHDGRRLAFVDHAMDACGVVDLEAGRTTPIPGPCRSVELSPDGRHVAHTAWLEDEARERLLVYSVPRGASTPVDSGRVLTGPWWSARGDRLFFSKADRHLAYDLDAGEVVVLGRGGRPEDFWRAQVGAGNVHRNQRHSTRGWASTPDGRRRVEAEEGSLYLVDYESHERTLLLENTGCRSGFHGVRGIHSPSWTRTERYVVGTYLERIVVVDVTNGRSGVVARGSLPLSHVPARAAPPASFQAPGTPRGLATAGRSAPIPHMGYAPDGIRAGSLHASQLAVDPPCGL